MTVALSLAVLVGVVTGCGADTEPTTTTPSQDTAVRAVVAKFGIATQKKDYRQICDELLSQALVASIEDVGLPCEGALQRGLGDVKSPTLQITDVSINGDKALVSVHTTAAGQQASNDALQLVREQGSWRIASLDEPGGGASSTAPQTTTTPPSTTKAYPNGND
jgi:Putative lumazine-binding